MFNIVELQNAVGYYLSVQLSKKTKKETISALKPPEPALPGGKRNHIVLMESAWFFVFVFFNLGFLPTLSIWVLCCLEYND